MKISNLEMKYIGVCSLLSQISSKLEPDDDFQYSIECALDDFIDTIENGKERFTLVKLQRGIILEPKR